MYSPSSVTPVAPAALPELLLVDSEETFTPFLPSLRERYRVSQAVSISAALRQLERTPPALIATELALPDGSGDEICRAAKQMAAQPTVMVMTPIVENVPSAIDAGCDAVLLKPFPPNLFFSRLGRLMRARSAELRYRAMRQRAKTTHLQERSDLLLAGTNQHWPNTHCPYCSHAGVTSFEFASYRRSWYACLACKKAWLAKRQE